MGGIDDRAWRMAADKATCENCGQQSARNGKLRLCTACNRLSLAWLYRFKTRSLNLRDVGASQQHRYHEAACRKDHTCKACGATFRPRATDRTQ